MLLTDDEIFTALDADIESIADVKANPEEWDVIKQMAVAIQTAFLAKLASAELPEPVVIDKHESGYEIRGYKKDQLRQAYAQGAASRLRDWPDAFAYRTNGWRWCFSECKPPDDAYDEGTLTPLFTLKEPK